MPKHAADEGPYTVDDLPALESWGNDNTGVTSDEKDLDSMRQDEVQDNLNNSEKSDISEIYIISN